MSPEAARLFIGCSISFFLGGAAGVFGLSTLYGDIDRVEPDMPRSLECPPPPPCPACPPPVDCGDEGMIPPPTAEVPGRVPSMRPGDGARRLPGLPASAIPLAHRAVRAEIAECLEDNIDVESGLAVLELTVTATGAEGFISDAVVIRSTGGGRDVSECLTASALRARFAWTGADGQLHFKLPVSVGGS